MKKVLLYSTSMMTLIFFTSCGPSTDDTNTEKPDEKKEISNNEDVKANGTTTRNCCFKTEEEGFQFFPVLTEGITTSGDGKPAGSIADCYDENGRSHFNQRFVVSGTEYLFKLEDKCADPVDLSAEYERSRNNEKKNSEIFKDMDREGVYRAFGSEDKKRKLTFLFVMVDGRFKISITGFEKTNLEEALKLLACVPLEKLAAYGK